MRIRQAAIVSAHNPSASARGKPYRSERRSLATFLDTLPPEQWTAPTWCDKWNVQELVGHLTAAGNITAPHFFAGFIRSGFTFDKFVDGDEKSDGFGTTRFCGEMKGNARLPSATFEMRGGGQSGQRDPGFGDDVF